MILLIFVIIGAAAGLLAKGSFKNLAHHGLRGLWLCILSFLIQGVFSWVPVETLAALAPLSILQPMAALARYGLLLAFVLLNIRRNGPWPWAFGAGTAANAAVILASGGAMPVAGNLPARLSPDLAQSLAAGEVFGYTLGGPDTPLWFLGDVLYLRGVGFGSIGDILIGLGGGLLIFRLLRAPAPGAAPPTQGSGPQAI